MIGRRNACSDSRFDVFSSWATEFVLEVLEPGLACKIPSGERLAHRESLGAFAVIYVGCPMKLYKSLVFTILVLTLSMSSCYHEFGPTPPPPTPTTTLVNLTITSTPSTTFSFPSLNWPIGNITIVDNSGNATSLGGSSGIAIPDFARLQTDSLYLGNTTLAAASYTTLKVELNSPASSYFYNSTAGTLLGCATGTVCLIPATVAGFGASTVTVPITYTATANTTTGTGIRVNFDLSKAVTSAGGMTFDFTQTGAITISTLPPTSSQPTGIDTVDNFTGVVTAISGSTITVSSFASEPRTFTIASTATFNDPMTICSGVPSFSCLAVNQNVSLDGYIGGSDGSFNASEVEFLDPAPATNELEGVIVTPVTNDQFKMVLTNGMGSSGLTVSSLVTVNLNNVATYHVDPKSLGISTTPLGFLSQTDLVLGQTVMLQGGTVSTATLNNSTRVLLRYSSIGGTVQAPSGTIFNLSGISPFLTNLSTNSAQVQTFPATTYDNITGFSELVNGANASVRALYLNPNSGATQPILAAKVRTH